LLVAGGMADGADDDSHRTGIGLPLPLPWLLPWLLPWPDAGANSAAVARSLDDERTELASDAETPTAKRITHFKSLSISKVELSISCVPP